jgi:peroxiredoxin
MIELGELEKHAAEFAKRQARIVAASLDEPADALETQKQLPHLTIVSDPGRQLIGAFDVLHAGAGRNQSDAAAPTTFLIDGDGQVRWMFRPSHIVERVRPADLLGVIDS